MVVYSVVWTEAALKSLYLSKHNYMATRDVILFGNKVDLDRKREVPSLQGSLHYSEGQETKDIFVLHFLR